MLTKQHRLAKRQYYDPIHEEIGNEVDLSLHAVNVIRSHHFANPTADLLPIFTIFSNSKKKNAAVYKEALDFLTYAEDSDIQKVLKPFPKYEGTPATGSSI